MSEHVLSEPINDTSQSEISLEVECSQPTTGRRLTMAHSSNHNQDEVFAKRFTRHAQNCALPSIRLASSSANRSPATCHSLDRSKLLISAWAEEAKPPTGSLCQAGEELRWTEDIYRNIWKQLLSQNLCYQFVMAKIG